MLVINNFFKFFGPDEILHENCLKKRILSLEDYNF